MLTDIKKAAASGILISIGGCVLLASTKAIPHKAHKLGIKHD